MTNAGNLEGRKYSITGKWIANIQSGFEYAIGKIR
jgi:hypothetical protein